MRVIQQIKLVYYNNAKVLSFYLGLSAAVVNQIQGYCHHALIQVQYRDSYF